ncbi:MAG: hypothetical protein JEZ03_11125 [Bacteroidales bacterium]|nr:hypothetical protein [Bacteroidales bacterium]
MAFLIVEMPSLVMLLAVLPTRCSLGMRTLSCRKWDEIGLLLQIEMQEQAEAQQSGRIYNAFNDFIK